MSFEIRQKALLNEYKGNLFEYLVAVFLARKTNLESDFVTNLSDNFRSMLSTQESFIREYFPTLLVSLPELANSLSDEIIKSLDIKKNSIEKISIIGKAALASHDERYAEADILLKTKKTEIPISLKLSKAHAYVNTKSGGLKSFLSKYFKDDSLQRDFSNIAEKHINQLTYDLYALYDLEPDQNFKSWVKAGLTELPGQLSEDARVIYKKFLFELNTELYKTIEKLSLNLESRDEFKNGMTSLLGFSDPTIIQATTYYKPQDESYVLYRNIVESSKSVLSNIENIKLGELKDNAANFDIFFSDRILQLRIKAMNKFTSKSYKVNCSVKID